MFHYSGNGAYCYANSLHMCLRAAGATDLPDPGFLECLTTEPFGKAQYGSEGTAFFPSGPVINPDSGLTLALKTMGWTCDEQFGGTQNEALKRLRTAIEKAPVLVGPLAMDKLTYNPDYTHLSGADHFIVVLSIDEETVRVHDPAGFPNASLSISDFIEAWRAEAVFYGRTPFMMRSNFQQIEVVSREEMIARTIPHIRHNLLSVPADGYSIGGVNALCSLAESLRQQVTPELRGHLVYFVLPLAARRLNDAAHFLAEGSLPQDAKCAAEQSRLFGEALQPAVHNQWITVAEVIDRITDIERCWAALT
jgi:hypothetical protein